MRVRRTLDARREKFFFLNPTYIPLKAAANARIPLGGGSLHGN
jgi:hypothetical protein